MTVLIPKHKLLVTTSPKSACSSIKAALFYIENKFEFHEFTICGEHRHIHHPAFYPAIDFSFVRPLIQKNNFTEDMIVKFTVVRNPIERFLSAYSNRVCYYQDMQRESDQNPKIRQQLEERGLPSVPDLATFISYLDKYRAISPTIRLHTAPQTHFIGKDPSFYDTIFTVRQIKEFEAAVTKQTNVQFKVPHLQTGGEKILPSALTSGQLVILQDFYRPDIEFVHGYC